MQTLETLKGLKDLQPHRTPPNTLLDRTIDPKIHGLTAMAREAIFRQRVKQIGMTAQALISGFKEGKLGEVVRNELHFYHEMDLQDRGLNTVLDVIKINNQDQVKPSSFGERLDEMREDQTFDDHNGSHSRRVEMHYEAILNSDPKTHTPQVSQWVGAGYLFTGFHDAGQLLAEKRNIEENRVGTPQELNVKKGHGIESAVMVLALTKRIAQAKGIPLEQAWKEARGTAYISMEHDDLIGFSNGDDKLQSAYIVEGDIRKPLDDETLFSLFKQRKLDRGSLSPNDLIRLLRITKQQGGFIDSEDANDLGMDRAFQQEYATELAALSNDTTPLMSGISKEDRRGLDTVAQAAVTADILDMLTPPEESITRKLSTQYSKQRPIYPEGITADTLLQYLQTWDGHPGNGYNSDAARILWEYLNPDIALRDTRIAQNPYLKNLLEESTIMGAISFKNIGTQLMQGNIDVITNLYKARSDRVRKKALKHAGYKGQIKQIIYQTAQTAENPDEIIYNATNQLNRPLAERFLSVQEHLKAEAKKIQQNIVQKPHKDGEERHLNSDVRVYPAETIGEFNKLIDGVLHILCQKYSVTPEELAAYETKVGLGVYPDGLPFNSYDTLAVPGHRRVLWKVSTPTQ